MDRDFPTDPYSEPDLDQHDRDVVKQWFVATFGSGDLVTKWSRDALKPLRLCGAPHNRNYAERTVMQSARSTELRPALFSTV
jgi:hypothetical protein